VEESIRVVTELSGEAGVMAIAGPLTGGAAAAAAEQAQRLGIPLLSLSPREGLPETGSFIFRNSLTSRQQVQTLVSYAMEQLGITTFAILHPENNLGYEMTDLFIREVQYRGGQVVATQMYDEKATDFRRQVKLLKGEDPDAPEVDPRRTLEAGAEDDEENQGVELPFQALFIPDYADKISLIAPQLLFYGIEDVQLLGINGWNSTDLLRTTGRYLQGAIFVDGFFRDSDAPAIRQFVAAYVAAYDEEPSILEAQGFDVANILLTLLDRPEIRTRQELQQALSQIRDFQGVSGNTTFGPDGDAAKTLFLLQIDRGAMIQLN
jgi:ABC-type branched-subunit amino acid transport system substrate-binding protein